MLDKHDLPDIVIKALRNNGNKGTIVEVCQYIWNNYEEELRKSNDLFYTWQYDMRWVGVQLRKEGIIRSTSLSLRGLWILE